MSMRNSGGEMGSVVREGETVIDSDHRDGWHGWWNRRRRGKEKDVREVN